MDSAQDSLEAKPQDEFASGDQNRLRQLTSRFVTWMLQPPYFPAGLTWFLLALIATNSAIGLVLQPDAYWIDPGTLPYYTFLGTPLKWGIWNIGVFIVYTILVGLAILLLNVKPAFGLWIAMSVYHFWIFTNWFRCGTGYYFFFENPSNCSGYHAIALAFAGILWGFALFAVAALGLVPWIPSQDTDSLPARKWMKGSRTASMIWTGLMGLAVMLAAIVPKPVWRLVETEHTPRARTEAALAYDTQRSVAILFGGATSWAYSTGWQSANDTWEWDGNDWIEMHPAHSPSPRLAAVMAFDELRGITVLFGGSGQDANSQTTFNSDTWEWDGMDWTEITPALSPPPREGANMYFDPLRGTIVIYGGHYFDPVTQTNGFLDDAWEWDGKDWQQIQFDEPRRISSSAIVYDRARQLAMLMDGEGLWFWEGPRWIQPNYNTSPPGRWNSEMVYDPGQQQVALFGGYEGEDVFNDTWIYNGQAWQKLVTTTQPPVRNGHTMFYDQTRGRVMLFGGLDGGTFYNDTWELIRP